MNNKSKAEFLRRRKSGIGGSDAAAIMGLSRWRTPLDVYRDKTTEDIDDEPSDILELSSYLEEYTAQKWAEQSGFGVRRKNVEVVHPDFPFLKGNIDRQIINTGDRGPGVLECKALSTYNYRNIEMHGLPDEYIIQMQFYLATRCFKWGSFAILNRDNGKLLRFEVMPDEDLIGEIVQACADFWTRCVIMRIEPVDIQPEKVSIPKYDGKISDLSADDELGKLCSEYDELSEMKSEAESLCEDCKKRIQDHLGEIQAAECSSYRIYYANGTPRITIDSARLKKEKPDIFETYKKETAASRNFRFYKITNERN